MQISEHCQGKSKAILRISHWSNKNPILKNDMYRRYWMISRLVLDPQKTLLEDRFGGENLLVHEHKWHLARWLADRFVPDEFFSADCSAPAVTRTERRQVPDGDDQMSSSAWNATPRRCSYFWGHRSRSGSRNASCTLSPPWLEMRIVVDERSILQFFPFLVISCLFPLFT